MTGFILSKHSKTIGTRCPYKCHQCLRIMPVTLSAHHLNRWA